MNESPDVGGNAIGSILVVVPTLLKSLVLLVVVSLVGFATGLWLLFAEMTKFDIVLQNNTNLDFVTPERSEGQLERIGLYMNYSRTYDFVDDGLPLGDAGLMIGNFLISLGSFLFTAIAIVGPTLGWETFRDACKSNPIRMLVPILGYVFFLFLSEWSHTHTHIYINRFPAFCSLIWIVRGFMFTADDSGSHDELQNNLYMLGILIYLSGTFLSVYNTLYVLKVGDTVKRRLKLMFALAGPSVVSVSMAAILFPRIVMPIYADPETSDVIRGAFLSLSLSLFHTQQQQQQLKNRSHHNYGSTNCLLCILHLATFEFKSGSERVRRQDQIFKIYVLTSNLHCDLLESCFDQRKCTYKSKSRIFNH